MGDASFDAIKREADATTRTGRLHDIEQFSASRFIFLRFNYTTGDAAGQNMTGRATSRACERPLADVRGRRVRERCGTWRVRRPARKIRSRYR
jgi:hydroxymethylglutaryl-CoA reductase